MSLSVIFILYNAVELLQTNLANILAHVRQETAEAEFLFVDNASADGSLDYLAAHCPQARIIQQGHNRFFAPSANTGIRAAQYEYILLLNLDIRIVQLNLQGITALFEQDPDIFSISPKIIDPRDNKQERLFGMTIRKGLIDSIEPGNFDAASMQEIPYGTGGALFLRKSYFLEIGGFREIYAPFYWDDPDLGIRAVAKGWRNLYFPDALIYHYHSSQISIYFDRTYIQTIFERNRLIFFWLNTNRLSWRIRVLIWLPFKLAFSILTDGYFFRGFVEFLKIWEHVREIPSQSLEDIIQQFV